MRMYGWFSKIVVKKSLLKKNEWKYNGNCRDVSI